MQKYLQDEKTLKNCKIYQMLKANAEKEHLSFHTPGHKNGEWDITELSFSDNLSSPTGCILEAEREIAEILGAKRSFLLTDGSTSGVLAMLYAAKESGVKTVAVCIRSHKSVFNGCKLLGLTPLVYENGRTMSELNEIFKAADCLFFTSPDYYGRIAELEKARAFCNEQGKLLLVDGAHGGHLHFDKSLHAGGYADMWVDGVHKSLPAFTQGAVVSARTEALAEKLEKGVDIFRTTSPSYPIMASVEYAVKYPRNLILENLAKEFQNHPRILKNEDWTKLCVHFGEQAFEVEKLLEAEGIFSEFCDGEYLTFYLSPATKISDFERLKNRLTELFESYLYSPKKEIELDHTPLVCVENKAMEWVEIERAVGKICAENCGLFPPCTPLILRGERVMPEKVAKMKKADNTFGLKEGKILVYVEE